jgi:hypothetical protein
VALRTYSDNDRDFSLLQLYRRVLAENPNVKIVDDKSQADIGVSLVSVEAPFGGTAWSTVVIEYDPNRQPILKGHWLYTSSANDLIKEVRKTRPRTQRRIFQTQIDSLHAGWSKGRDRSGKRSFCQKNLEVESGWQNGS